MTYLVLCHTSHGSGVYLAGHYKSQKRAEKLVKALERPNDMDEGVSWIVRPIFALDKFTDESAIEYAKGL